VNARAAPVLVLLALGSLSGCLGDEAPRPALRGFTALYELDDGMRLELRLDGPRDLLGPDGHVRAAYTLASRWDPSQDAVTTWSNEDLDASLRVVRHEGCFVWNEEHGCGHERISFQLWSEHPGWGIGLPLRLPSERHGDLLRVADPHAAEDDLADNYYEYKPGELWPQRHVRASHEFDYKHTSFRLVSVEPGEILEGAVEWPVPPQPEDVSHAMAPGDLFPDADKPFLPLPFTVQEAVEALRADAAGRRNLEGGCIVEVQHFSRPDPERPLPIPPLSLETEEGTVWLDTFDAAGVPHPWTVSRVRDAFGTQSFQVQAVDQSGTVMPSFSCSDRAQAIVGAEAFLAMIPTGLGRAEVSSFSARWWRSYEDEGLASLQFTQAWYPEGGHYRSATMDASTGWWLEFAYLPGEGLDQEQNG
jgi:hypothetical protein